MIGEGNNDLERQADQACNKTEMEKGLGIHNSSE